MNIEYAGTSEEKPETREEWAASDFIDYLNEVDELLEGRRGYDSTENEMEIITECKDQCLAPEECVHRILTEGVT